MGEALISIVVPVYNVEQYLDQCVESILNQTYKNIEVLLMDDASPDGSGKICDAWAERDSRVRVFHLPHGGLSVARNKGLENMTGQYVLFVDSDDYIAPDLVATVYGHLVQYDADMVIFDFKNFYDSEHETEPERGKTVGQVDLSRVLYMMYGKRSDVVYLAWNKLYKKELFDGITYPEGRIFEDNAVAHKLLQKCNTMVYDENQYYFRRLREDSIMGKSKRYTKKNLAILYGQKERCELYGSLKDKKLVTLVYAEYLHTIINCYCQSRYVLKEKMICDKLSEEFSNIYDDAKKRAEFDLKKKIGYFSFRYMPRLVSGVKYTFGVRKRNG